MKNKTSTLEEYIKQRSDLFRDIKNIGIISGRYLSDAEALEILNSKAPYPKPVPDFKKTRPVITREIRRVMRRGKE